MQQCENDDIDNLKRCESPRSRVDVVVSLNSYQLARVRGQVQTGPPSMTAPQHVCRSGWNQWVEPVFSSHPPDRLAPPAGSLVPGRYLGSAAPGPAPVWPSCWSWSSGCSGSTRSSPPRSAALQQQNHWPVLNRWPVLVQVAPPCASPPSSVPMFGPGHQRCGGRRGRAGGSDLSLPGHRRCAGTWRLAGPDGTDPLAGRWRTGPDWRRRGRWEEVGQVEEEEGEWRDQIRLGQIRLHLIISYHIKLD